MKEESQVPDFIQKEILCILKNIVRKGTEVFIPRELLSFVELHLEQWIRNALIARIMTVNEDYIIDIDRSDAAERCEPNVVIMDNQTGVEQYNSQWNCGLHQFLQLKHSCRISHESLKAVFMSNVTYFKQYLNMNGQKVYKPTIFGLSGTLGSQSEKKFLQETYNVSCAVIPTFKPSRFEEKVPQMFSKKEAWLKAVCSSAQTKSINRPVLIICETVDVVNQMNDYLCSATKDLKAKIFVYKRSYEPLMDEISEPCIFIATNLAGRGTDLKISDDLSSKGGLHVCLTYLPTSVRVEEQGFGRAARKGQKGSGEIIFWNNKEENETIYGILIASKIVLTCKHNNFDLYNTSFYAISKHLFFVKLQNLKKVNPEKNSDFCLKRFIYLLPYKSKEIQFKYFFVGIEI